MNISHSKVELYNQCGMKYRFKYIDKLDVNKTFTPLLLGSAIDSALNYVLIQTKVRQPIDIQKAKDIFQQEMNKWHGQNELVFFKSEAPDNVNDFKPGKDQEWVVWNHLYSIGLMMLDTYVKEIVPLFDEVIDVQITKKVDNAEGDTLVLVVDFVAKLKDGRIITFDNKTAGDIKKSYPKNSVQKSQQLAIYNEFADSKIAGYIVLQKKLVDDAIKWEIITGEVPIEKTEEAFNRVEDALTGIKQQDFNKNFKNCYAFQRQCEYYKYCHFGNEKDIIKK